MKKQPNFFAQDDAAKFNALAPTLAADPGVRRAWGVLNVAQCSQENAEQDDAWSLDYLSGTFSAYTGRTYLGQIELDEIFAIWNAAR